MNRQTAWDEEYDPYKAASGERSSLIFDDTYRTPQKARAKEANSAGISFLQWFSLFSIIGGFVLGCVITVANHFVFAYFNGKRSDQFPQFWVTALKNILPKLAHVSWTASLSCSVAQAVRFPTSHYVVRCADYLSTHTDMVYHSTPIIYAIATRRHLFQLSSFQHHFPHPAWQIFPARSPHLHSTFHHRSQCTLGPRSWNAYNRQCSYHFHSITGSLSQYVGHLPSRRGYAQPLLGLRRRIVHVPEDRHTGSDKRLACNMVCAIGLHGCLLLQLHIRRTSTQVH